MRRASAAGLVLVVAASAACDPPESISAEDALQATCVHARAAFGYVRGSGAFVAEPREVAQLLDVDARLLRSAGDEGTAALVERTAEAVEDRIGTAPDLVIYLRDDVTARQRTRLEERAARLRGVDSVRFVPAEEAYEPLEDDSEITPDVPPDSFEVAAAEGTDVIALRDRLDRKPGVDEIELRDNAEAISPLRRLADVCDLPS